jgi:cysteine-rich repeat protein
MPMFDTHSPHALVIALVLPVVACGDAPSEIETDPTEGSSGTEAGDTTAGDHDGDETGTDSPDSDPDAGSDEEDSGDATGPMCGDGVVDADEACDDGNDLDGDGCNRDCRESGMVVWEHRDVRRGWAGDVDVSPSGAIYVVGQAEGLGVRSAWAGRVDARDGEVVWSYELVTPGDASASFLAAVDAKSGDGILIGGRHDDSGLVAALTSDGGLSYEQSVPGSVAVGDLAVLAEGDLLVKRDGTAQRIAADGVEWSTSVGGGLAHRTGDGVALAAWNVGFRRFTLDGDAFEPTTFAMPEGVSASSRDVAWTSDGDVVVAGDVSAHGASEGLVLRSSSGGHLRWMYGPQQLHEQDRRLGCLAVDSQDAVVVGGSTDLLGEQRPFVMKLSPEGEVLWTRALELEATNAIVNGCTVTPADEIVVAGRADGHLWFAMLTP